MADEAEVQARARLIREAWASTDETVRALADRFGITERMVRYILTGERAKEAGGPLFSLDDLASRPRRPASSRLVAETPMRETWSPK